MGDGNWSLTIKDVQESDFGDLHCVATNENGKDECAARFGPSSDRDGKDREGDGYPPRFNVPLWDRRVPEGKFIRNTTNILNIQLKELNDEN